MGAEIVEGGQLMSCFIDMLSLVIFFRDGNGSGYFVVVRREKS